MNIQRQKRARRRRRLRQHRRRAAQLRQVLTTCQDLADARERLARYLDDLSMGWIWWGQAA